MHLHLWRVESMNDAVRLHLLLFLRPKHNATWLHDPVHEQVCQELEAKTTGHHGGIEMVEVVDPLILGVEIDVGSRNASRVNSAPSGTWC